MKLATKHDLQRIFQKQRWLIESIWLSTKVLRIILAVIFCFWIIISFLAWVSTDDYFQHETFLKMLASQWRPFANVIHRLW